MNLYFFMTALFVVLALVGVIDSALTSYAILPWFNGLRWLRVHVITLGAMTEALFGLLPALVAVRYGLPRPKFHLDTWLTLNIGLLTLLIGIPLINQPLIFTGGSLIFAAAVLLIGRLWKMRPSATSLALTDRPGHFGRRFYLAGLGFLLLGILVGTGLWLGWSPWLAIKIPLEVHIHANNWGFLSLVFAGLLVDLYPSWANRPLAWKGSIGPIFWMMTLGALGLVLGPWFQATWLLVPGLILHVAATIWLLMNVIKPLVGDHAAWTRPGVWHLVTSYFWILAPILVAPLILLEVPGFPGAGIEQNAPQALIYGWVFQFGYAILPFFFHWAFSPGENARLGGSWFSLAAVHLGGIFLWLSIFVTTWQGFLHGTAYVLWGISIIPIAIEIWGIVRSGLNRLEDGLEPAWPISSTSSD